MTFGDDLATPNTPMDVAGSLYTSQAWLRSANVMQLGDFLRDMGLVRYARDVETVFGQHACVCGGTFLVVCQATRLPCPWLGLGSSSSSIGELGWVLLQYRSFTVDDARFTRELVCVCASLHAPTIQLQPAHDS